MPRAVANTSTVVAIHDGVAVAVVVEYKPNKIK